MEASTKRKCKRWFLAAFSGTLIVLALVAATVVVIDPFFHYHAPLPGLAYPLRDERYQNDGILRHFTYDAIITGTSMTQNFLSSQFDALWGATSVKVPLVAARYQEVDQQVRRAIKANPGIRYVVRGLDTDFLTDDPNASAYGAGPTYLYDDDPFNDVNYVLNKEVLSGWVLGVLKDTADGKTTTSFDDYKNWQEVHLGRGREKLLAEHTHSAQSGAAAQHLTEEDRALLVANLEQNVLQTVRENPDITFYYFFTPYSICYWDGAWSANAVLRLVEEQQAAIEAMVPYENLHLFSFDDAFSVITDLEMYMNVLHYDGEVNRWMLACMRSGEHRLTSENYRQYLERIRAFYTTFDYDGYFAAPEEEMTSAK